VNRQDVRALYNAAYADAYERTFLLDPVTRTDTETELRLLAEFLTPGVSWLDVACGTGFFLRHFPDVDRAGIDLSPSMLALARQGNPETPLREQDFRDPIPGWEGRWGLVSCMWYAYGLVDTIAELDRLVSNLWAWTSKLGTCFVPLADPALIAGVDVPFEAPTNNVWSGKVMITGIQWSYIQEDAGAAHTHMLAPNVEFMTELFGKYFAQVDVIRYPPPVEDWQGRPAIVATQKRDAPVKLRNLGV
jgi:SAM-dependent methyltransferase